MENNSEDLADIPPLGPGEIFERIYGNIFSGNSLLWFVHYKNKLRCVFTKDIPPENYPQVLDWLLVRARIVVNESSQRPDIEKVIKVTSEHEAEIIYGGANVDGKVFFLVKFKGIQEPQICTDIDAKTFFPKLLISSLEQRCSQIQAKDSSKFKKLISPRPK